MYGALNKAMTKSRQFELLAREVSAGNSDLSARTEQQAASIEPTAPAMEQLVATIRETA
jgi:methyl-accepting chemotaxis protein